jgi:hypothetical protein
MPKTNKQRERAKRRRRGESVVVNSTNISRMQMTHMRQSDDAEMARWAAESAQRQSRRRK